MKIIIKIIEIIIIINITNKNLHPLIKSSSLSEKLIAEDVWFFNNSVLIALKASLAAPFSKTLSTYRPFGIPYLSTSSVATVVYSIPKKGLFTSLNSIIFLLYL